MENTLNAIDNLFEVISDKLKNHNEVFLIENQEDFGYFNTHGESVYEGDYQVYTCVSKHGHFETYAIRELKDGIAYLIGINESEGSIEIPIDHFGMGELYDLAKICNF